MPGVLDALLEAPAPLREASIFEFVGITDDVTACDLCGRSNLKRTVILRMGDGGGEVHYGSDCAARALGWGEGSGPKRAVEKAATAAEHLRSTALAKMATVEQGRKAEWIEAGMKGDEPAVVADVVDGLRRKVKQLDAATHHVTGKPRELTDLEKAMRREFERRIAELSPKPKKVAEADPGVLGALLGS